MDQFPSQVLTDSEIHTLVDGQASPEKLAALQLRLSLDPAGQATFQKWQRQCDALRGLHKPVLDAPVPKMLQLAAQQSFAAQQEINQWWRWGGMAASVLLAFHAVSGCARQVGCRHRHGRDRLPICGGCSSAELLLDRPGVWLRAGGAGTP